jgi:hypothetical protein
MVGLMDWWIGVSLRVISGVTVPVEKAGSVIWGDQVLLGERNC